MRHHITTEETVNVFLIHLYHFLIFTSYEDCRATRALYGERMIITLGKLQQRMTQLALLYNHNRYLLKI